MQRFDVVIIGGGQSALAVAYFLRRTNLSFVILDKGAEPGGSWQYYWKSLRLFSPAQFSSLPGILMTGGANYYPSRDVVIEYLKHYETKYQLPVKRPVEVLGVHQDEEGFLLGTADGSYKCRALVSATGSFDHPYIPSINGRNIFRGTVIHSKDYFDPIPFVNKRTAIVGDGNSGAQILAEVSTITETIWVTLKEPKFLPDEVDGRYLFDAATQVFKAQKEGIAYNRPSLGDIVMVPPVKDARARGVLRSVRPFSRFSHYGLVWENGREERVDSVIFCTGFGPSLTHLSGLHVINSEGKADTVATKSKAVPGLWFVGYGNWTGFASATLVAVGRSAKKTVEEIKSYLSLEAH